MRFFNEHDESNPKIPCGVCNKNIAEQHKRVTCSICNYRVHIKCNKIDVKAFDKIKNKVDNISPLEFWKLKFFFDSGKKILS